MARLINLETAGKERTRLAKAVVIAIREFMHQSEPDEATRDIAAFISLSLETIAGTIDASVEAWEKRGYWVKADRFRMEWVWAGRLAGKLREAVLSDDWPMVAQSAAQVAEHLNHIVVPKNHRLGIPWEGSYRKLRDKA